jgi:hypothetical protein
MKHIKKLFAILIIITSSCSIGEENLEVNKDNIFYERVNELIQNPNSYASVIPQKINPFDITLEIGTLDPLKKGFKVQESEVQTVSVPEEIKFAEENFKNLLLLLIKESKRLSFESFEKLSYSLEVEIIGSALSEVKKDFLLKELAVLKFANALRFNKINRANGRIACDSQFECDVLACVEAKVADALNPDENNWIDLAYNIYSMATDMPRWWASCTWDALTD